MSEESIIEKNRINNAITIILLIASIIIILFIFQPFGFGIYYVEDEPLEMNDSESDSARISDANANHNHFPKDEVKLIATLPLTNELGNFGIEYKRGIDLAVDEINRNGGMSGVPVSVTVLDNHGDSALVKTHFQKAYDEGYPVIIGPLSSSAALAIAPYAEIFETVVISPGATSADLTTYSEYFYRTVASDAHLGAGVATILCENEKIESVVLVYFGNSYGMGLANAFKDKVAHQDTKLNISKEIVLENGKPVDTIEVVNSIYSENPDAVFITLNPDQITEIMAGMRDKGMKPLWFGSDVIVNDEIGTLGQYAEGTLGLVPVQKVSDPTYEEKYFQKYGEKMMITNSIYGYDTLMLLSEVIQDNGYSPLAIKKGLDLIRYLGVTGAIAFDDNGDRYPTYDVMEYYDGKWNNLKWSSVLSLSMDTVEH